MMYRLQTWTQYLPIRLFKAPFLELKLKIFKIVSGEATEEDIKKASQLQGSVLPIKPVVKRQRAMELTDDLKKFKAFNR